MAKIKPFWIKPSKPYERVLVYSLFPLFTFGWNDAMWYPPKKRWEHHSTWSIPWVICWKYREDNKYEKTSSSV